MSDLWNLRKLNLFAGLKPEEMQQVMDIVTVKHYQRGDLIFTPGDRCDRLYLLQQGRVKTYLYSEQVQEKIRQIFYPGDAFGGLLVGTAHQDLPWARALDDVILAAMDEDSFKQFMGVAPDQCLTILRHMAGDHAEDMRRRDRFIHTDAGHRLLHALLKMGDRLGYSHALSFQIDPCYSHEELANKVGLVRSTVSELIELFRCRHVLGGYGRCLIVNRRAAEQFLLEYQS